MSTRCPLVGVTTYYDTATWGSWRREAAVVQAEYFELVAAAGGMPLLLPPFRSTSEHRSGTGTNGVEDLVDALDALVLVGGGDVDPGRYGVPDDPRAGGVDPVRDRWELALLEAALARDLPVLAICRGHQLLNVHLGGTLLLHVPDDIGHDGHQPGPGEFADVTVLTVPESVLFAVLGPRVEVCCSHHQAIDRLGDGLEIVARSEEPGSTEGEPAAGVVEGVVLPHKRFVIGVQWHPEQSGDRRLFDALIAACR